MIKTDTKVSKKSIYIPILSPIGGRAGYRKVILQIRKIRKEREKKLEYKFD